MNLQSRVQAKRCPGCSLAAKLASIENWPQLGCACNAGKSGFSPAAEVKSSMMSCEIQQGEVWPLCSSFARLWDMLHSTDTVRTSCRSGATDVQFVVTKTQIVQGCLGTLVAAMKPGSGPTGKSQHIQTRREHNGPPGGTAQVKEFSLDRQVWAPGRQWQSKDIKSVYKVQASPEHGVPGQANH